VPKSPVGWSGDRERRKNEWGLRVKPCVVDWNGDGRLDLLIGDMCGGFEGRPTQTPEEIAEEKKAQDKLPELRQKWAAVFAEYRKLLDVPAPAGTVERQERELRLTTMRERARRLSAEIGIVQEIQERYVPQSQSHGFVWLFLRKPASAAKTPAAGGSGP
jgi:hypothetical protein